MNEKCQNVMAQGDTNNKIDNNNIIIFYDLLADCRLKISSM